MRRRCVTPPSSCWFRSRPHLQHRASSRPAGLDAVATCCSIDPAWKGSDNMKGTSAAFVASLLVACSIAADAQTAVSVRPVAAAGRTIHVTTTQDLSISATGLGPGPIAMQSAGTLAFTQVNKPFNDQGQMDAEITIEKLEMTQSLNGATGPKAADAIDPVGQKMVVVFDRTG